jgi:hypothetical protein
LIQANAGSPAVADSGMKPAQQVGPAVATPVNPAEGAEVTEKRRTSGQPEVVSDKTSMAVSKPSSGSSGHGSPRQLNKTGEVSRNASNAGDSDIVNMATINAKADHAAGIAARDTLSGTDPLREPKVSRSDAGAGVTYMVCYVHVHCNNNVFVDFAGLEDDTDDYAPVAKIGTLLLIYSEYVLLHRFSARTVPEDHFKSANDEGICKDRQTVDATGCCDRQDPVLLEGKVSIPFNLLGLVGA